MARTNNVQHLLFARVNIRAQILSLCSLSAGAGRELDARASSAQLYWHVEDFGVYRSRNTLKYVNQFYKTKWLVRSIDIIEKVILFVQIQIQNDSRYRYV